MSFIHDQKKKKPGEGLNFVCGRKGCQSKETEIIDIIFNDGTEHKRQQCKRCKRYIKFVSHTYDKQAEKEIKKFKYRKWIDSNSNWDI